MDQVRLLFGLDRRVTRSQYFYWGVGLMLLKYLGEIGLYFFAHGEFLLPWQFLNPVLEYRYPGLEPDWFYPGVATWSLPFIWIGVSMTIRRFADAGWSPWWGLLFFVPGVNVLVMLALSLLPSSPKAQWSPTKRIFHPQIFPPLVLTVVFALIGTLFAWISLRFGVVRYGNTLFVGAPLVLGLVQGFWMTRRAPISFFKTAGYVLLTVLLIHLLLLIFALEGVLCLAMSLPIAAVLALIGAFAGAGIGCYSNPSRVPSFVIVLALPFMPFVENYVAEPHRDVILSVVEIDAPPEKVWNNVVKFADLPAPTETLFHLGIAHPIRARIEGSGVGAIRHCEFSTGAFVEPITIWDAPNRLAFDVADQPAPMKELSFYDHVRAPHLHGFFRSTQGEFLLVRTPDGKTRLEGRTWYEMDMHPGWYWQIYGRWFIHTIHLRVLNHVKNLSEQAA